MWYDYEVAGIQLVLSHLQCSTSHFPCNGSTQCCCVPCCECFHIAFHRGSWNLVEACYLEGPHQFAQTGWCTVKAIRALIKEPLIRAGFRH